MYTVIDDKVAISVNDWCQTGLTRDMFENDSKRGFLSILRRGWNGNTLIDVKSIKRPERLRAIEAAFGKLQEAPVKSIYTVEIDTAAREFFVSYRKADGTPLTPGKITEYTNRASIFNALRSGMRTQIEARAARNARLKMKEFWPARLAWFSKLAVEYGVPAFSNERSLERAFKQYLKEGYPSLIHKGQGNDSARRVSEMTKRLVLSLWRSNNKPFKKEVHKIYLEFVRGEKEFFDRETGEVYQPADFRHKGRPAGISEATVWNILKDHINEASAYATRNGQFAYRASKRPHHHRKAGEYSLSKVSMDDAVLSRKGAGGDVRRYCAIDVKSGYWFRPVYTREALTEADVIQCLRNMFCELVQLGLPVPGEVEHEHHLFNGLDELLKEFLPFTRECTSAMEKRAEHGIRSLKWGVAKKNNHTRGRFFARGEEYRSIRFKKQGDFVEKEHDPRVLVADDLADIEEHNNSLHPLQKRYPGMTRREVFLKFINPNLPRVEPWYLYKFIGNETSTSIRNNDHVKVNYQKFLLDDFAGLKRLKPGDTGVTAYWVPNEDGSIDKVYVYQGATFIGEATSSEATAYNEFAFERTADDEARMLEQHKRGARFDSMIRETVAALPRVGYQDAAVSKEILEVPVEIVEPVAPVEGVEVDYMLEMAGADYAALARSQF